MATYNGIKKIKIGDNIFNLYDSGNSGGTITQVKTTAGAHTTITVTSGAANFNVPTTAAHVGINFGYTTSGNNRAVQQDSSGNLYVTQKDNNDNTTYALSGALSSHKFTSTLTAGGSGSGTSTSDFTLVEGPGISITDDTNARKMTIACTVNNTDTKNTAGSTDTSSKIFLIGATSQTANSQTYSHDTAYVDTDGCLYSGGSKVLTSHQDISGKFDKSGGTITGSTAVTANFRVGQFTANTSQSAEYQSHVWGGAGKIFMYAQADKAGNVGMYWYPASGTNGGGIFNVNQSGQLTLKDNTVVSGDFKANGNIIANGHSSAIGTIKDAYLTADKSIANNTATSLCSLSLEAGTWLIYAWLRFPSNATGSRVGNIGTSGASDWQASMPAVNGNISQLRFTRIVSLSSTTTYHLNALQTSGAAMTMATGSAGGINSMRAVRIA